MEQPCASGMLIMSLVLGTGTDKRMRLWNTNSGANSMTKFMDTRNTRPLGWSIAVSD